MRCFKVFLLIGAVALFSGCGGSGEAIMPEGELTAEQEEAVKQEDQEIMDEEMGGGMAPVKPGRRQ